MLENCLLAVQAHTPTRFAMLRPVRRYTALLDRARATLASLELGALGDAVVKNLSHGEQRQLEIALALAGRPQRAAARRAHRRALARGVAPHGRAAARGSTPRSRC